MSTEVNATTQPPSPIPIGLQFTETMRGFFSTKIADNYQRAAQQGQQDGSRFEFTLTVVSDDLEQMLTAQDHKARMFGSVTVPVLGAEPLTVTDGEFNLFIVDPEQVNTRQMRYRIKMTAQNGKVYYLDGFKLVHDDPGIDIWADTTTLYITMYDGDSANSPVLGKGILKILPVDFIKQMTTLKITNASNLAQRLHALDRFSRFFAGTLAKIYT